MTVSHARDPFLEWSSILIQIYRVARAQRTNWPRRHIPKKLCQHCGREEAVPCFLTIDGLRQHAAGRQSIRLRYANRRQKAQQVRGEWEKIRQENGQCRHLWCRCHHWQQHCKWHFLGGSLAANASMVPERRFWVLNDGVDYDGSW
jgi:hypothetical protein